MSSLRMIMEIRSAEDGIDAAAILAKWMMAALDGACANCRNEAVLDFATDLLPLVRPDMFAWRNEEGQI